jgi:hypothetical protein
VLDGISGWVHRDLDSRGCHCCPWCGRAESAIRVSGSALGVVVLLGGCVGCGLVSTLGHLDQARECCGSARGTAAEERNRAPRCKMQVFGWLINTDAVGIKSDCLCGVQGESRQGRRWVALGRSVVCGIRRFQPALPNRPISTPSGISTNQKHPHTALQTPRQDPLSHMARFGACQQLPATRLSRNFQLAIGQQLSLPGRQTKQTTKLGNGHGGCCCLQNTSLLLGRRVKHLHPLLEEVLSDDHPQMHITFSGARIKQPHPHSS